MDCVRLRIVILGVFIIGVKDVLLMLFRDEIVKVVFDMLLFFSLFLCVLLERFIRFLEILMMFLWFVFLIIGIIRLFGVFVVKLML